MGYAVYGKRSAEADPLVYHANGAITPFDPANAAATAAHLATKGYPCYAGYPYVYGKRSAEAEADPQFLYAALPYAYVVPALVAHPNGAVVPVEPADVVKARAEHLAAVAAES